MGKFIKFLDLDAGCNESRTPLEFFDCWPTEKSAAIFGNNDGDRTRNTMKPDDRTAHALYNFLATAFVRFCVPRINDEHPRPTRN